MVHIWPTFVTGSTCSPLHAWSTFNRVKSGRPVKLHIVSFKMRTWTCFDIFLPNIRHPSHQFLSSYIPRRYHADYIKHTIGLSKTCPRELRFSFKFFGWHFFWCWTSFVHHFHYWHSKTCLEESRVWYVMQSILDLISFSRRIWIFDRTW